MSINLILKMLTRASSEDKNKVFQYLREGIVIHPLEEEFGAPAEVILEAIYRSSELTKRGVRGIIAEAYFDMEVLSRLEAWNDVTPEGDHSYDNLIKNIHTGQEISIQVKMQRKEKGEPKLAASVRRFNSLPDGYYIVETQRTRTGKSKKTSGQNENTRPYRYEDFDLLAVSMEPCTKDWSEFRFTVSNWLISRKDNESQIDTYQPVSLEVNDDWTDELITAIDWLNSGMKKTIKSEA